MSAREKNGNIDHPTVYCICVLISKVDLDMITVKETGLQVLMEMLETMETSNSMSIRELNEQMSSDPDLSAVHLDVLTSLVHKVFGILMIKL